MQVHVAGSWVTGGVVVHHDESVGGIANSVSEDFAGVHQVISKCSDGDQV